RDHHVDGVGADVDRGDAHGEPSLGATRANPFYRRVAARSSIGSVTSAEETPSGRPLPILAGVEHARPRRELPESKPPVERERGLVEVVDEQAHHARALEQPRAELAQGPRGDALAAE